ncbi:MAG: zinc-binding alcohol dehydrogenase family protein [Candidatus Velthaea sp.]
MKAVRLHEIGGPQNLRVETIADPAPGEGEIAVKIHRAAFNRRDVFITQGLYPGIALPRTLGSDGSGVVAALGVGATGPAQGTAVVIDPMLAWGPDAQLWDAKNSSILGMPRDGTFAEYVVVPAQNVYTKPKHLSDDEAAAIPLAGLTAYRALVTRGRATKHDVVLITGIGGGVQTFVLLFAKHIGAKTIVTSSSDEKLARAKAMGADVTINYATSESWSKEARAAAGGGGPSLVVDSAGGDAFAQCLDIARPGARIVTYGGTHAKSTIRMFSVFWKHLDILGTSMGAPEDFAGMLALMEAGQLRPALDDVVAMDDVVAAAEKMNANQQFGKVVLAVA